MVPRKTFFARSISAPEAWISLTVLLPSCSTVRSMSAVSAPAGEVAEVGAQRRAITRKGDLMVGVNSAVAELEGDEVELRVFGELRAQFVAQHRARAGFRSCTTRRCAPSAAMSLSSAARAARAVQTSKTVSSAPAPAVTV